MNDETPLVFMKCTLLEMGFSEEIAIDFTRRISRQFGGGPIYIHKVESTERRENVLRQFNGRNRKEICAEHGLSKAQFYRILKGS
ncbi:MAG: Mor transcription activator family protein [Gallionellaceae bacterium]